MDSQVALGAHDDATAGERRRAAFGAGAILAIAILVRISSAGAQPLWGDEAYSWLAAQVPVAQLFSAGYKDRTPPLYYLLLHPIVAWSPASETALRMPSALASSALLVLVTSVAWRWLGARSAPWAALVMALSTCDLAMAQEARVYALLNLVWLATAALLVEAALRRSVAWLALGAATNALLPALHALGIAAAAVNLALLAAVLVRCAASRRTWKLGGLVFAAASAAVVGTAFFSWRLLTSMDQGAPSGVVPSWLEIGRWVAGVGAGLALAPGASPGRGLVLDTPLALGTAIGGAWLVLAAVGMWSWSRRDAGSRWAAGILSVSIFGPLAATVALGWIRQAPVWSPKLFWVAAGWLALGSAALVSRQRRRIQLAAGAAMLGLATLSLVPYFTSWQKGQGRTLAAATGRTLGTRDAVVVARWSHAFEARFYFGETRVWIARPREERKPRVEAVRVTGRFYARNSLVREPCPVAEVEDLWIWPDSTLGETTIANLAPGCREGRILHRFVAGRWETAPAP